MVKKGLWGRREKYEGVYEGTREYLRGLEVPKISGGPNSVEKRGPAHIRGVLKHLHCPEIPLGKKG